MRSESVKMQEARELLAVLPGLNLQTVGSERERSNSHSQSQMQPGTPAGFGSALETAPPAPTVIGHGCGPVANSHRPP